MGPPLNGEASKVSGGLETGTDTLRPRADDVSAMSPETVAESVAGALALVFSDRIRLESVPSTWTSTCVNVPSAGSN